jgi:osmotically-inducible protein OsmY
MTRTIARLCGVVTLALVAVACAQTDAGVTTAVKSKLTTDDMVKAYQIDVDTKDHVVTLSGNVETPAAKERAVALARATDGVQNVVDNIKVAGGDAAMPGEYPTSSTGRAAEGEVRDEARDAGRTVSEAGRDVGRTVSEAGRDVGRTASEAGRDVADATGDAAVTAAVKSKFLADTTISGLKIDVDTKDNVVTLTGTVGSAAEKAEAVRIARATSGVKSVRDNLKVAVR